MEIRKLIEIPILSSQLDKAIQVQIHGLNIDLIIEYIEDGDQKQLILRFKSVLCHNHTSKIFTKAMLNAYDTIVEIEDSDWLEELRSLNENDFKFWKLKHYAIYLEKLGMYQFAAREYEIMNEIKSSESYRIK